jgi:hypothetical protein
VLYDNFHQLILRHIHTQQKKTHTNTYKNCRQPLAFLSLFREHESGDGGGMMDILPSMAYVLPTFCEYCGSEFIAQCGPNCERPPLFFQRMKPFFASNINVTTHAAKCTITNNDNQSTNHSVIETTDSIVSVTGSDPWNTTLSLLSSRLAVNGNEQYYESENTHTPFEQALSPTHTVDTTPAPTSWMSGLFVS